MRNIKGVRTKAYTRVLCLLLMVTFLFSVIPPVSTGAADCELHVEGNLIKDALGNTVRLTGVNIPSMVWGSGEYIPESIAESFDNWKSNVLRVSVNQDFWFGYQTGKSDGGESYRSTIDSIVAEAAARSKYVLIDLHWSDRGVWGQNQGQQPMPDNNSMAFWLNVCSIYKNNPNVLFGIYNEPNGVSWEVWRNGGTVTDSKGSYPTPGHQKIIEAIRDTGAKNICVVAGLDWSYDLRGIGNGYALVDKNTDGTLTGNGIIYDAHIYPWLLDWDGHISVIKDSHPILIGECGWFDPAWMQDVIVGWVPEPYQTWNPMLLNWLDANQYNWTAWNMHPSSAPNLITGWNFNPSPEWGAYAKPKLQSYFGGTDPVPSTPPPAKGPTDAYSRAIRGEYYTSMSGVGTETCVEGRFNLTDIHNGDYVYFQNVNFGTIPTTEITVRVAGNQAGGSIELRQDSLNGTLLGTIAVGNTGGDQVWTSIKSTITGISGIHDIYLKFTGSGTGPLFNFNWFKFTKVESGGGDDDIETPEGAIEAEDAVLVGVAPKSNNAGYTGTGFADYLNVKDDYIEWSPSIAAPGYYSLQFRYANGAAADRPLRLDVNGITVEGAVSFPSTVNWTTWKYTTQTAYLNRGVNTIRLTDTGSSGGNVDHLMIVPLNLALDKTATASSSRLPVENTTDGMDTTRWSSNYLDDEWITVDLGESKTIDRVRLSWETAYGLEYKIQVSDNGTDWTDVYYTNTGDGAIDDIRFAATNARYIRMLGIKRGTNWGYSLWEFEAYAPVSLEKVALTSDKLFLHPGDTASLAVSGIMNDLSLADLSQAQILYASENQLILTVDESGTVSAVGEGKGKIAVTVTLGGITEMNWLQIIVDKTPAVSKLEIDKTPVNGWFNSDIAVTLSAKDSLSGLLKIEYRIGENGDWTTYTAPLQWTEDGVFNLYYYSTDKAGNVEAVKQQTISMDKTLPAYSLLSGDTEIADGDTINDANPLVFNVSDDLSGLVSASLTLNGTEYAVNVTTQSGIELDLSGKTGSFTAIVRLADAAGNVVEENLSFTVTTSIESMQSLLERYVKSGDLRGPLQVQLKNSLRQAQHMLRMERPALAVKHMEDFIKHLNNKAFFSRVSEQAKAVLNADAEALIQLWSTEAQ